MRNDDAFALDRPQMRAAFDRAAETYDKAASLQREVADRLLERLRDVRVQAGRVLDVGCGTGYGTRGLMRHFPGADIVALDIAHGMLQRARRAQRWRPWRRARFAGGDAERLPFADASADVVFSNLTLQWCDIGRVLTEFRRVLRPGGLLMFTTFGPDTLIELRSAWASVDDRPHVHGFLDMRDLGDRMLAANLSDPVVDVDRIRWYYPDVASVLRSLKQIGAHNVARDRDRGLTGKLRFQRFRSAYEALANDKGVPVTYEVVFGHAWAPSADRPRPLPGEAVIPISAIGGRRG